MSQVPSLFDGLFGTSPDVSPGFMSLPPDGEAAPMPYSPEGWNLSKIMPGTGEGKAPAPEVKKEQKGPSLTPDQAAAIAKLVGVEQNTVKAGGSAGWAGAARGQVGQMGAVNAGGVQTGQRSSLGQIIYGGKKF